MAQHVLSIEAPDTMNKCLLRLVDTSIYSADVEIDCPILEVTLPGYSHPVQFTRPEVDLGFILNLTACHLKIQTDDCGTKYHSLPDGIYVIRWSVSPNDVVYVEYNHLRMTSALTQYQTILCELDVTTCAPESKLEQDLRQLNLIRTYLDAAKATVEVCHEPIKGMEIYKYAVKLLNKFECKTCQEY